MQKYGDSKHLKATREQDLAMKKLHDLRNEFLHFTPKGWSLEVSGGPALCLHGLGVIEFLARGSGTIWWRSGDERSRYDSAIAKLIEELRTLKTAIFDGSLRGA
jgi:hypothetical protein